MSFFDDLTSDLHADTETPDVMQALRDAVEELRDRPDPWARIVGQKRDIYDLLIDMGCQFDRTDDGPVPVPVVIGSLGVPIVEDDQAPRGVVIAEHPDGTTARAWLRSRRSPEWFVVEDGRIIDLFRAARADQPINAPGDGA